MTRYKFFSILLLSFLTLSLLSCASDDGESQTGERSAEIINAEREIDEALHEAYLIERDISRDLLLKFFRENERLEIEELIHNIKVTLLRLKKNPWDLKGVERLKVLIDTFESTNGTFLQEDQARLDQLIQSTKEVFDILSNFHKLKIVRELYVNEFDKELGPFQQFQASGRVQWKLDKDRGRAKISGFKLDSETWLFSPILDLTEVGSPTLQITQGVGYFTSWDDLTVLISTNYRGGDPRDEGNHWETLTIENRPSGLVNWEFVPSENIDLSAFAGQSVVVAFRYRSTKDKAATWELERLALSGDGSVKTSAVKLEVTDESKQESERNSKNPDAKILFQKVFQSDMIPFQTFNQAGAQIWEVDQKRKFIKMSGYSGASKDETGAVIEKAGPRRNEDWLVSPAFNFAKVTDARLQIRQTVGFLGDHGWENLKVKVSTNFSGDVMSATWEELKIETRPKGDKNWEWVTSELVDLNAYLGKTVHIGFHYRSSKTLAATWEIGSVVILGEGSLLSQ